MPINKFAGWGFALEDAPRPPGLGAVLRVGLATLNTTFDRRLSALTSPAPMPRTPSSTALRIIWSLNAVRDALSDQDEPSVGSTNAQLERRFSSKAVGQVISFLERFYEKLLVPYQAQFRSLDVDVDGDDFDDFDLERRKRMAEVASFEWAVMAIVEDPSEAEGFEWVEVAVFEEPQKAPNWEKDITAVDDETPPAAAAKGKPSRPTKQRR